LQTISSFTGDKILLNGASIPLRKYNDPADTHIRNGGITNYYYKNLPHWLNEKFPIQGNRNFKVNPDPQILYLPRRTKLYLLRNIEWGGVDLSCWTETLDSGNYWGNKLIKIYHKTLEEGLYNLHVNKAVYLFENVIGPE
jgi:hypothetical protein